MPKKKDQSSKVSKQFQKLIDEKVEQLEALSKELSEVEARYKKVSEEHTALTAQLTALRYSFSAVQGDDDPTLLSTVPVSENIPNISPLSVVVVPQDEKVPVGHQDLWLGDNNQVIIAALGCYDEPVGIDEVQLALAKNDRAQPLEKVEERLLKLAREGKVTRVGRFKFCVE